MAVIPSRDSLTADRKDIFVKKLVGVTSSLWDDEGASMVEYALLVVLIAVIAIVAVNLIGPAVSNGFSSAGSGLAN